MLRWRQFDRCCLSWGLPGFHESLNRLPPAPQEPTPTKCACIDVLSLEGTMAICNCRPHGPKGRVSCALTKNFASLCLLLFSLSLLGRYEQLKVDVEPWTGPKHRKKRRERERKRTIESKLESNLIKRHVTTIMQLQLKAHIGQHAGLKVTLCTHT